MNNSGNWLSERKYRSGGPVKGSDSNSGFTPPDERPGTSIEARTSSPKSFKSASPSGDVDTAASREILFRSPRNIVEVIGQRALWRPARVGTDAVHVGE